MERKIFFIGCRKIHSTKQEKDFYMIDYVRDDVPKTDYVDLEVYNKIASKNIRYKEVMGVFSVGAYDKIVIYDIKA